jgi:hypothetical protein
MTMKSNQRIAILFTLLPFLVAVLIMTPRLTSPQFGVMDDGLIYVEVQKILQGDLSMSYDLQAGRFRPLYWSYFTVIYLLAGPNPFLFFIGHLVILLVLLIEIRLILKFYQARTWQILLTSLVFIFSIPIIENFYTLSKGDPLSLVFILASILSFEKFKKATYGHTRWVLASFIFISGLFAIWAKETAYIMAPISACWAGYSLIQHKNFSNKERGDYLAYFVTMAASMGAFFLIRALLGAPGVTEGTFTERYVFTWEAILSRIPRWLTLFVNYYHYLVPYIAMIVIILISRKELTPDHKQHTFEWGIWMLAWIGALLPWEYAKAYYLLSFSLGVSILIGLFAPHIWDLLQNATTKTRWLMITLSVLFIVLFLASLTHYRTHARTQLIFDRMNHHMLEITHEITPPDGSVFTSLETRKEYVEGIQYFLVDFYGLTEINYTYVSVETLERMHMYPGGIVLMPYINNMPRLLVRAGVDEEFTMLWNEIVLRNMGDRLIPVSQHRAQFRIVNLNLGVIFCPLVGSRGYCENPDPFLDTRLFSYGWDIFQIK